jgi:signal transduction histidine kinase/CheY-like chemotaxis protein
MIEKTYKQVLFEFREDIFERLTIIIAFASLVASFALVFLEPLPHQYILSLQIFAAFMIYVRSLSHKRPNLARYVFIASLYAILAIGMVTLPVNWLPFIVAPLLFVSELLVSSSAIIAAVSITSLAVLLVQMGRADYPLQGLGFYTLFALAVIHSSLRVIWVLLHWYFSMFTKTNALLEETRQRRAELQQTLKSLEIAHETQERLQAQLVYARQQAEEARIMKERFASNISHELRSPLNIILGFTEIMHLRPEVYGQVNFPPKLQQDIYQVHSNSRHLLDLIDDVLDLSHIEMSKFSLNFERTDLNTFLQTTLGLLGHLFQDKPVEFIVEIPGNLPEIQLDRTRIRQVIINLLNNAHRFTARGSVRFSVEARERDVIFRVSDTGIGIPQNQLKLIFEEFFQVDYSLSRANGGAGLGLAITRRFVEAHHGKLTVESLEGVGSTFSFTLPLPTGSVRHPEGSTAPVENPRDTLWLVIDADEKLGRLVNRYSQNASIVQVSASEEVKSAITRYRPQGIIYNVPQEAPLPESLENLDVPIVICSLPSTSQLVRNLGVNGCLSKPILPEQLVQAMQGYPLIKSVLIVDDDVGVVQLFQRTMENSFPDLRVLRAYNGLQALDLINNHSPDLIVLDLVMPNVSGYDLIGKLKANPLHRDIPIILLTASKYVRSETEARGDLHIHQKGGLKATEVLNLINSITQIINH